MWKVCAVEGVCGGRPAQQLSGMCVHVSVDAVYVSSDARSACRHLVVIKVYNRRSVCVCCMYAWFRRVSGVRAVHVCMPMCVRVCECVSVCVSVCVCECVCLCTCLCGL